MKKKTINIWKTQFDPQSQAIYVEKYFFKKNLHILEDSGSGVPVGDIEQVFA